MTVTMRDEQATLWRVAGYVAEGMPPEQLLATVTEEVGRLFGSDAAGLVRYVSEDVAEVVGNWTSGVDEPTVELGSRWPIAGGSLTPTILHTGKPARIDDWSDIPGAIAETIRTHQRFTSSVGAPILVDGRVWGVLSVHANGGEPLPGDTEVRLSRFAHLLGAAIANAQAHEELHQIAAEQAALRRVATLVARESSSTELFAAVTAEMGRLLGVENVALLRYEEDATSTVVARWGERYEPLTVGMRIPIGGHNVTAIVHRTGRPTRVDDTRETTGAIGAYLHRLGLRATAGAPVIVRGRLWGVMVAAQAAVGPMPADTEARIVKFADLAATALANAQAREDLAASRTRIVAAADEERRRVVRDLHDGAQQRLVHTMITLKLAQRALASGDERAPGFLADAVEQTELAIGELRELAHGILPSVLTRGGLRAGVRTLAQRSPVPVDVEVDVPRLAPTVEATAYFVVAEALTNVAKHAQATRATVHARVQDAALRVEIGDDGVGGARLDGGGLGGLADRLAALAGQLRLDSPAGGGTRVAAEIPLTNDDRPGRETGAALSGGDGERFRR